ncbi:hypothetical protein CB1_000055005 [Camelus ferus]|nr:hypothetical protein CB1_000055005 [Camelus ferus]
MIESPSAGERIQHWSKETSYEQLSHGKGLELQGKDDLEEKKTPRITKSYKNVLFFQELVTVKDEEMDFTHVEEEQLNSAQRFVGMDMKVENCGSLVFWDSDAIPETKVSLSKQDAYEEIPPEQELIIQRLEKDDAWECGGTLERQQRIPKKDVRQVIIKHRRNPVEDCNGIGHRSVAVCSM